MSPSGIVSYSFVGLVCLFLTQWTAAQDFEHRQRQVERPIRVAQEAQGRLTVRERTSFEFGGWFTTSAFLFHDEGVMGVRGPHKRVLTRQDLRIWGYLTLDNVHEFYARGRMRYDRYRNGDSFTRDDDDVLGPNLERGWYAFDLRRAMRRYGNADHMNWTVNTKVGRQYVEFGSGLSLSLNLDAVLIGAQVGDFNVRGLLANTVRSTDNIDRSIPVRDDMDRCFYGVELSYSGFNDHHPFIYYITQQDHTDEEQENTVIGTLSGFTGAYQSYSYDSSYFGLGSTGSLLIDNLKYVTELVYEFGETYDFNDEFAGGDQSVRSDVDAWAFDVILEYFFRNPHKAKVSAEYLFASGDDDRLIPTDTFGGNIKGDDHAFNGFGYRYTGYQFAPRINNIQIVRLGGALTPLPDSELLKNIEVGTNLFFYHRTSQGGMHEATAGVGRADLGHEADAYLYWRIFSDLSATLRYGVFFPGEAYEDTREARHFLFAAMTYSF